MLKRLKKALSKKNKLKRLLYAFRMCLKRPELYPLGRYPNVDIDACVDDYINNMKAAKYYAELLGAKYLSFLQPFNGSGKRQLSAFDIQANAHIKRRMTMDGNNELELIGKFYDKLWNKVKDNGYVFDLREIFDDYKGEIYFDQVHCSDIGYEIIARRIGENI